MDQHTPRKPRCLVTLLELGRLQAWSARDHAAQTRDRTATGGEEGGALATPPASSNTHLHTTAPWALHSKGGEQASPSTHTHTHTLHTRGHPHNQRGPGRGDRFRCPAWCGASDGAWRCSARCYPCACGSTEGRAGSGGQPWPAWSWCAGSCAALLAPVAPQFRQALGHPAHPTRPPHHRRQAAAGAPFDGLDERGVPGLLARVP